MRQTLESGRDQPKIILCHVPLIPLRDDAVLAKSFGFSSYYDQDGGTLDLLEEHTDNVIAVLSGHLHLTGMKERRSSFHISASGTASYPSDAAVVYKVFPDRIEVNVKALPPELAQAAPSFHGKARHGHDFTDADHRTAQEYECGRADERSFIIPLTGGKRPSSS